MRALLDLPMAYRLFQAPFVSQKLAPLERFRQEIFGKSILDVGCGPAVNKDFFKDCEYLGLDLSSKYVVHGNKKFPGHFILGDAAHIKHATTKEFDFVLANSIFHHLDELQSSTVLNEIHGALKTKGTAFIIDLCTDYSSNVSRFLTLRDRGGFPKSRASFMQLTEQKFKIAEIHSFVLQFCGVTCWDMIFLALRKK